VSDDPRAATEEQAAPQATEGRPQPDGGQEQHGAQPADDRPTRAELDQAEDRYKRALADLDNFRKRTARDLDRRASEAVDRSVVAWLDVVDSVERALRMDPDSTLAEGLRAVLDQIESVLARQGVQRIGAPGERFDPERHEAVDVRETDLVEDRTVVDVLRSGFARGDRVLRPAQVVVSRRPPAEAAQDAGG
jgi:molecular chaperone GrpE